MQSGVYPRLEEEERVRSRAQAKPKGVLAGGLAEGGLSPKMANFGPVLEGRKRVGKSRSPSRAAEADEAAAAAPGGCAAMVSARLFSPAGRERRPRPPPRRPCGHGFRSSLGRPR